MGVEHIECWRPDARRQGADLSVAFDVDARDDAVALLDEWHAEIGD